MAVAEGVQGALLGAGVDMGEGATIEEDMIVDMDLEADIEEVIGVDLEAMPHTEKCLTVIGITVLQTNTRT